MLDVMTSEGVANSSIESKTITIVIFVIIIKSIFPKTSK